MQRIFTNVALALFLILFTQANVLAQGRTHDIKVNDLPENVKKVLIEYISALKNASTLDEAASAVLPVMGGSLVNEDGQSLRNSVKPYSLKKDWQNIKFYANPIKITRVNSNPNKSTSGYGESAINGRVYKIWIDKKDGVAGLPAPISIMVPSNHESIKTPKIIGIGSL